MKPQLPIRIVIATDRQGVRERLVQILDREESTALIGVASDALQAIDMARRLQPDVVLLDVAIPGMDPIDVLSSINQLSPTTKPFVLPWRTDNNLTWKAREARARGYLLREASVPDLIKSLEAVHHGERWVRRSLISDELAETGALADVTGPDRHGAGPALTKREHDILRSLSSGGTNKDIAKALCISEKTVKCHLNSVFRKLQVTRRIQAVLYAADRGWGASLDRT